MLRPRIRPDLLDRADDRTGSWAFRRARHMRNGATKLTTDKFDAIDIRDFQRRSYLGPGCEFTISLNRTGTPHSILDGYTEKEYVVFPKGCCGRR